MTNKGDLTGLETIWRRDKLAKFLKSLPNIHQISPNVFFFRQTFSIHLAITIQWQWWLLYFLYTYNSFPPQCCLSKHMASYYLYTYKSLLPLCGVSLNLQDIFCHSSVSIRLKFRMVFFFRQTFSIHLAITIQWQWCLLYFLYTYNSFPPQCCLSKPMASYYLYTYKSLLPLCGVSLNLQDIFCHSSVSIRLTFRMVYLHVPILYVTVMSLIFLTTPWHLDVLCYHSTASVSLPFEFLVIIVLCPTISQLKVVATFNNIMEKKKKQFH